MQMTRTFQINTRKEAAQADRLAEWAKTPRQRLADMEVLRAQRYENGIAPRLQGTVEFIKLARR